MRAMPTPHEDCWSHPVLAADALPAGQPQAVRLLDQPWVLWRDAQGQPLAAPDRCPHRGARLSLGRVDDGLLQCPYHGWCFGPTGACVRVPAMPEFQPPASHGLGHVVPLSQAHGLLWLRPDGGAPRLPAFAAEADDRLRKLNVGPYRVQTSAPRIVENFLDLAHFGTVHAGWLGDAQHLAVPPYTVTVDPADGVLASGCQAWQPRSNLRSAGGSWVSYDYRVPAPFAAVLEKAPEQQAGWRESIALFIQPETPSSCQVWFRLAVPDWTASDEQLRAFQHTIFCQDQPVLESQEPKLLPILPASAGLEVHCGADRSAMAYRRYLNLLNITFGVC